jgi:hypothetical protein
MGFKYTLKSRENALLQAAQLGGRPFLNDFAALH